MNKLFSCLYGSGLYGTKTPTSDRDVKHIVLPSLDHLLLGKKVVNIVKKTNNEKNTRNGIDDVDEEFIPLQIFAKDFMMGQTYALELAYALEGDHAEQTLYNDGGIAYKDQAWVWKDHANGFPLYYIDFVCELRAQFLTSNIKAMMGYVVNQASLYSFKGERLNVARELLDIMRSQLGHADGFGGHEHGEKSLTDLMDWQEGQNYKHVGLNFETWELSLKYPKYFKESEYDIGQDRKRPCYVLLEKTLPHTMTLRHAITVVETIVKKYGSRADAASESNVDWKATMHALRIVDEGLMVLTDHKLEFPLKPEAVARLLSIRRGEVSLTEVTAELNEKLDRLKTLEKTTSLPATSEAMRLEFEEFMSKWLRKFYKLGE